MGFPSNYPTQDFPDIEVTFDEQAAFWTFGRGERMNCSRCKAPGMCVCPIEHPAATKQREQMHRAVARDAKLQRDDIEHLRRKAEAADARRNELITRGEILDALDSALGRTADQSQAEDVIHFLREAFE